MLTRTEYSTDIQNITSEFKHTRTILNEPTGNFFYDPWKLKAQYKGTIWETLLSTLSVDHGEARVIVMEPGTTYMAHADIDDRYHLNLQGDKSYLIDIDNEQMYLLEQDGYWYEMNAGKLHVASNFGSCNRIQLVVRKLLQKNNLINPIKVRILPRILKHDIRFEFDEKISPWLNSANKENKINDFSHNDVSADFYIEKNYIGELKNLLGKSFKLELI